MVHAMRYKIQRIPGGYRASLFVNIGDDKEIVFSAAAYEQDVQRAMERRGAAQVGFSFKKLGRSLKKLTKSKALRKAARTAISVAKSKEFGAALMAVNPALGIGVQTSMQGLEVAEKLLGNATRAPKGSKKRIAARATIKAAMLMAKKPDAQAQTMDLLQNPMVLSALALKGAKGGPKAKGKAGATALNYLSTLCAA